MMDWQDETLCDSGAEMAALGCCLQSPKAVSEVLEILESGSFFKPAHSMVFTAIVAVHDRGEEVDHLTVRAELTKRNQMIEVGGQSYLFDLENQAPALSNARYYAAIVRDFKTLRDLRDASDKVRKIVYDAEAGSVEKKLEAASAVISGIAGAMASNNLSVMQDVIKTVWSNIDSAMEGNTVASRRIPTHLRSLSYRIKGWPKGEISVIAGRTSMGKTVFGRGEALSIAKQKIKAPEGNEINQPVLYVSTEVSEEQLVEQLLASHSGVSKEIVEGERAGNELDYARLGEVAEEFYNLPMYYLCRGDKSLVKIKQKAEEVKRIHGVYPIIILDYLQALVRGGETGKSYQVGAFLSDLKNWIQDEQICVLALAQLSRDSAKPDKDGKVKLPSITDIADSKAVEDWAATIVILHRPEYYESRAEGRDEYEQSEVLMVCCKVRYGKSGVSKALFAPSRALFFDYGNEPKKSEMKQGVLA